MIGPIVKHATRHNAPVIAPMIGAFFHGDDEIERLPNRINCGVAEDTLGSLVPLADYTVAIRRDDCMWAGRKRGLRDSFFAC